MKNRIVDNLWISCVQPVDKLWTEKKLSTAIHRLSTGYPQIKKLKLEAKNGSYPQVAPLSTTTMFYL